MRPPHSHPAPSNLGKPAWPLAGLLAALVCLAPAMAQQLTEAQLVDQLRPSPASADDIDAQLAASPTVNTRALVVPGADGNCAVAAVAAGTAHRNLVVEAADPAGAQPGVTLQLQFGHAVYRLSPADQRQLDALARALQHPDLQAARYTITGHTDSSGDAGFNLKLSCGRSTEVLVYLVRRGVAASRLQAFGFGSARPIRPGNAEDGANRRVEVRLDRAGR